MDGCKEGAVGVRNRRALLPLKPFSKCAERGRQEITAASRCRGNGGTPGQPVGECANANGQTTCDNTNRSVCSLIKTGSYLDLEVARRASGRGVLGIGSTTSPFLGPASKVWRNMTFL